MSLFSVFKSLFKTTAMPPAEKLIERPARRVLTEKVYPPLPRDTERPEIISTIEESDERYLEAWRANVDIIVGLQFVATMQLRTPLRVLERHDELHTDINASPPRIAQEMWEGIWLVKTRTYREMGIDLSEFAAGSMATDIGPISGGIAPYLRFLRAVRMCIEQKSSIRLRVTNLRDVLSDDNFKDFVDRHGGSEAIINRFFPYLVDTIPTLTSLSISELRRLRLTTLSRLANTVDEALLAIKGIGPSKLRTLREYCAACGGEPDEDRVDLVKR